MNKKDTAFCAFIAGAAITGSLIWLKNKIEEKDKRSAITVDEKGDAISITLIGTQCSKNFIKKKLPREMDIARQLQEQHFLEHPDGVTMYID